LQKLRSIQKTGVSLKRLLSNLPFKKASMQVHTAGRKQETLHRIGKEQDQSDVVLGAMLDDLLGDLLSISEQHHGVGTKEQLVLNASINRPPSSA
jgi:hypothetical protein